MEIGARRDQPLRARGQRPHEIDVELRRVAEATGGVERFARLQFAGIDGALGQQPGDDVHQPRRHLQRFTRETDADQRIERLALGAADGVEIGARLVGKQHRLGIKRVDQTIVEARFAAAAGHGDGVAQAPRLGQMP